MTKITKFVSLPLYEIPEPIIIAKNSIKYIMPLRANYLVSMIILHDGINLLINLPTSKLMELL
jgi:hypothetical protein